MATHLLSHGTGRPADTRPGLCLAPDATDDAPFLAATRMHEACGPARRSFAVWLAGRLTGPVIWIRPTWSADRLHAPGIADFAEPARFVFIAPGRKDDLLWCAEEALRTGAAPLVVADLPEPPPLTPVRRLHLAAAAGGEALSALRKGAPRSTPRAMRGAPADLPGPLGLLLCPGEGGAQGIETRWHMAPAHTDALSCTWTLERRRARALPPRRWTVHQTMPGESPVLRPSN
ncbi:hypothetical protein [Chachezhania antarctica]|uniref:hypothetical protein n=1 Tax=Chachezhania antarctica TaxID=2340860 RepID=UPI000EB2487A|nr:hypothetical protein [Chachezhania antarctica]